MVAAPIMFNCCIFTRLLRSLLQMTFDSRAVELSYHGNSHRGDKGQMKGSNLAFAAAEIGEMSTATGMKIKP